MRGASVLVSGAGPIGSLAVAALRAAGAREIVAADLQELPLEVARAVGADEVLRVGRDEVPADRFDLAVEAAGVVPSLETCLAAVRPGGTVLQLGILPAGALPITVSTLIVKELTLLGSQRFDVEMDRAIELLRDDASLDAVVSHTFPIEDAIAAFAQAADASVSSKVVIAVTEDPEER
ncbi:zinc-binding dehydrogenase [Curtobacterium flaccumfaciens]|nr:zinc-binding dehydrogenase [Curtobacterium flaccumfaciens]